METLREQIAKHHCDEIGLGMRYGDWGTLSADEKQEYYDEVDPEISLITKRIKGIDLSNVYSPQEAIQAAIKKVNK